MADKLAWRCTAAACGAVAGVWEGQARLVLTALLLLTGLGFAFHVLGMLGTGPS